jgi:uncharacterized membrane protein HdeD (DUF308 family)
MDESTGDLGLGSRWGWVVARGVVAVIFGLLTFSRPGAMSLSLLMLFAAYAFAGGITAIIAAARRGRAGLGNWGMLLVDGILGVGVAVMAVLWPVSMAVAFVWVIGAWALVTGALEIATAIDLRHVIHHEWALGLAGALTIALGVLMLARPIVGGLAIVWGLGAYALAFGALMIVLGFRLRSYTHGHHELTTGGLPQHG